MPTPPKESFATALAHQQAGRTLEAENLYHQILLQNPACADAYHMLGVLKQQTGDAARAIELIRKAISLEPQKAEYYATLGVVFAVRGRRSEAIDIGRCGVNA